MHNKQLHPGLSRGYHMKTLCCLMCLGAAWAAAAHGESDEPHPDETVIGDVTEEFKQLLSAAHGFLRGQERFEARGTLDAAMKTGDETQTHSYAFSMAKLGMNRFAMSVYREDEDVVLARLIATGRQGAAQIYLPRELNAVTLMARIWNQPEGLAVPPLFLLYDFLEYSKPERWLNMLARGSVSEPEEFGGKPAMTLDMTFNNYFSFRDLRVEMPVHDPVGDAPKIAGLRMDLSDVVRGIPGVGDGHDAAGITVVLTLDTWRMDAAPPTEAFAMPAPRQNYRSVGVTELFAVAGGAHMPAAPVASLQTLAPNMPQMMRQMPRTPEAAEALIRQYGVSNLIAQFQALPRHEQRRIINELRSSPLGAQLRSRARQMGLSEQDIRRLRSLVE